MTRRGVLIHEAARREGLDPEAIAFGRDGGGVHVIAGGGRDDSPAARRLVRQLFAILAAETHASPVRRPQARPAVRARRPRVRRVRRAPARAAPADDPSSPAGRFGRSAAVVQRYADLLRRAA